jgi:hypothetical protein
MEARMRIVLCVLSVCLGTGALAQEQTVDWRTFLPLAIGDEWVYREWGGSCDHQAYGGACREWSHENTYRVARDTVVEGASIHVVVGPGGEAVWGASADGSTLISRRLTYADSTRPALPPFPNEGTVSAQRLQSVVERIGETDYTVGAFTSCCYWRVAEGIGTIRMDQSSQGSGGTRRWSNARLQYVRLGGAEYGTNPANAVASEPAPDGVYPVRVFPNPATYSARLHYDLPVAGTVRIDAVDVLGRVVWERPPVPEAAGGRVVPVPLWRLPPGVYVLRVVADGDLVGTATVTRVAD